MFVKCESWHGLEYVGGGNQVVHNLRSVYGVSNVSVGGFGNISRINNFDNGQPGLSIASNFGVPTFVRMGPGITGNHRFTSQSDWYIHFATNINDTGLLTQGVLVWISDLTVFPLEMRQCSFCIVNDGPSGFHFELRSGNGWAGFGGHLDGKSTIFASSSQFKQNGVYYVQLHVNIGVSGSSRCLISGIEEWNVSGINTRGGTSNSTANSITFLSDENSGSIFGNIVIADGRADGLTPPFTDLLGEFVVGKIQPNGNGDANDFNPVGPGVTQNWQAVDEYNTAQLKDVDYNETSTSGNKDVMHYEDPNFILSGIVYGLDLRTSARKTDAGTRTLQHIIKPSTTEYFGYAHPLISTYTHFTDSFEINQDTGVRYTDAELDAHQFGYLLG